MYNKNKRRTDRRLPRRTEKAKYEKPPFSSARSIGGFSRESFPASPIFGLRLLGNDSFFVIITPLTQERHIYLPIPEEKTRITPACAGTTDNQVPYLAPTWDHPRLRGNDLAFKSVNPMTRGSPPLARKRQGISVASFLILGITPACAGKTSIIST